MIYGKIELLHINDKSMPIENQGENAGRKVRQLRKDLGEKIEGIITRLPPLAGKRLIEINKRAEEIVGAMSEEEKERIRKESGDDLKSLSEQVCSNSDELDPVMAEALWRAECESKKRPRYINN